MPSRHLDRHGYDVVFLSRGVLMWVEDIPALAEVCASLLKPGGLFYLLDIHPLAMAIAQTADGLHLQQSYFHSPTPSAVSADGSYAISDAGLRNQETREWNPLPRGGGHRADQCRHPHRVPA